jgi:hypothetical protein
VFGIIDPVSRHQILIVPAHNPVRQRIKRRLQVDRQFGPIYGSWMMALGCRSASAACRRTAEGTAGC